jgi:hypothetical protein
VARHERGHPVTVSPVLLAEPCEHLPFLPHRETAVRKVRRGRISNVSTVGHWMSIPIVTRNSPLYWGCRIRAYMPSVTSVPWAAWICFQGRHITQTPSAITRPPIWHATGTATSGR